MAEFSIAAFDVLVAAKNEALVFRHPRIGTEHLIISLLRFGASNSAEVKQMWRPIVAELRKQIELTIGRGNTDIEELDNIQLSDRAKQVLESAQRLATKLNAKEVLPEHLLLELLLMKEGGSASLLNAIGCNTQALIASLSNWLQVPRQHIQQQQQQQEESIDLGEYGVDLTALAERGALSSVIGRESEITRMIHVLCRKTKNNLMLVGEAGVGKTALAEGLAVRIASKRVPKALRGKRIYLLELSRLIGGTRFRGDFEERLTSVIDALVEQENIIVFIDEIHTLVGLGSNGAMDASNILKPALSGGELQCMGATTPAEYRKHIEQDPALARRFQVIKVDEPTKEETRVILKGVCPSLEKHHKVTISDEAVDAAILLSDRHIREKFFPDKALDVLDEASAALHIQQTTPPQSIIDIDAEIAAIGIEREKCSATQNYEKATKLRDVEVIKKGYRKKFRQQWKESLSSVVTKEHVADVIAKMSGVPASSLSSEDSARVLAMEKALNNVVIGQSEAVNSVSKAIKRARTGIKDPKRPIGVFMFMGTTGVGKTQLAKALADYLFFSNDALIQIDMSEYMEAHAVSKLIGSPPGYIGHNQGGQLSELVRKQPYSVILFDEIEKAHPDVLNLFLQIFEEGSLTDSLGRKIDFRNTVVIMTSNVGASTVKKQPSMGFSQVEDTATAYHAKIQSEAKRVFKPEFINRIDNLVVFNELQKPALLKIAELEANAVVQRLAEQQIEIKLTLPAIRFLAEKGYDALYGARPMRRALDKYLSDPLSDAILTGAIKHGSAVLIGCKNEKLSFLSGIPQK